MCDEGVVYVDRFELRAGKADEFERYVKEMTELVQEKEPGAIFFNYYSDESRTKGTALYVFSDAEALDRHLEVAGAKFQEGTALLKAMDIELLGRPSERAVDLAKSFNATVKAKIAGFSREAAS